MLLLEGLGLGEEITVSKDLLLTVSGDDLPSAGVHFKAVLKDTKELLKRGEKYLCYRNPFGGHQIEVCAANGAWLGSCELWDRPSHGDVEAIEHRAGQAAAVEREELKDVRRWAAPQVAARTQAAQHNAASIATARAAAGCGTSTPRPAEKRRARAAQAAANTPQPARRALRAGQAERARALMADADTA